MAETDSDNQASDFIRDIVREDLSSNRFGGRVHTRFPPEPNGYLHIGHAKSIWLNYGIAQKFGGLFNLRFDDTNPTKEEQEYVDAITNDVRWLGVNWDDRLFFASDYFDQLYEWALQLIGAGKAYVDDLSADEIREHRGTLTQPGQDSPYRSRSVAENLDLFTRMKNGEFPDGSRVLRAKIDMSSPNINLRDPVLYRILHASHHRTGDKWCIYPMYDWAHGQCDSLEGITHSICTLEFENNRPLYEWFLEQLGIYRPKQIEFARLSLTYTLMSKRKLLKLVQGGFVDGWDDPRMPTLSAMRRRGIPPEAIHRFCERIGVSKANSMVDYAMLADAIRDDLEARAPRVMAVLDPLKLVIENYPAGQVEWLDVPLYPQAESRTESRQVPFSRELYIEREDFMENPAKKYFRLSPGVEVRLFRAYYVTCREVVKDPATGEVVEVRCVYDPASRGGGTADGRRVKGTLHWVSAAEAISAEIRLYDQLFSTPIPEETPPGQDFSVNLNPHSLEIVQGYLEPFLVAAAPGERFQFMRKGYFCVDTRHSRPNTPVFNRTIALRDSWAKIAQKD